MRLFITASTIATLSLFSACAPQTEESGESAGSAMTRDARQCDLRDAYVAARGDLVEVDREIGEELARANDHSVVNGAYLLRGRDGAEHYVVQVTNLSSVALLLPRREQVRGTRVLFYDLRGHLALEGTARDGSKVVFNGVPYPNAEGELESDPIACPSGPLPPTTATMTHVRSCALRAAYLDAARAPAPTPDRPWTFEGNNLGPNERWLIAPDDDAYTFDAGALGRYTVVNAQVTVVNHVDTPVGQPIFTSGIYDERGHLVLESFAPTRQELPGTFRTAYDYGANDADGTLHCR